MNKINGNLDNKDKFWKMVINIQREHNDLLLEQYL